MTKKRIIAASAVFLLIVATLVFIFGNSLDSREESSDKSGFVTEIITPILEIFMGKGNVTEHFVRKLAHFTEFFILGAESAVLAFLILRRGRVGVLSCLLFGVLSALSDETIQLFTGRGPSVADVWLDFGGFVTAFFIVFLPYAIFRITKFVKAFKKKS